MPESNNKKDLKIKPHNQFYWQKRKTICKNPNCDRTKGMTPDEITEAGIPHQGYGYCSTCYGIFKNLGKLPKGLNLKFEEQEIYKLIGKRLKKARELQELSQSELARRIGYKSSAALSAIEKGIRRIQLNELQHAARILHTDINYFFGANYELPNLETYLREVCYGLKTEEIKLICCQIEALQGKNKSSKDLICRQAH